MNARRPRADAPRETVDLVVVGRIATLAGDTGLGWVEAIACAGGRVVAAGSRDEVGNVPSRTHVELAPNEIALPGLTDAHVHLLEAALAADRVELAGAATLDEVLTRIAAAHRALPPDAWLEGGGWDPNGWPRWPTAADLEAAAPGRRVALWAHDHHALLASERAMAESGISGATDDPPGGRIARADGRPTGVLHENASRLVTARIPPPDADRLDRAAERWCRSLLTDGIVAIHDMGPLAPDATLGGAFAAVGRLDAAGRLPVRVHAGVREESLDEAIGRGLRTGDAIIPGFERARVGWWKRFADGSLGSRTAFLRGAYEPTLAPGAGRGMALVSADELRAGVARARDAGIATAVHAIGDAGVDLALDALELDGPAGAIADRAGDARPSAVPRIEHAQLVQDDQLSRLARGRIAVSMQPVHARSDGPSIAAWGLRTRAFGYRWRSVVDAGIPLAFGSDAPVESPSPWPALAVAVDRTERTLGAAAAWLDSRERLALGEALRAACLTPALVAGETDRGRLVPGHRADLVVLEVPGDRPLEDPGTLEALRPRLVVVDGEVAFER